MSRHIIDMGMGCNLIVGWDNPLATFFWQEENSEGDVLMGEGRKIQSVREMVWSMKAKHADDCAALITEELSQTLEADRKNAGPRTLVQEKLASIWDDE